MTDHTAGSVGGTLSESRASIVAGVVSEAMQREGGHDQALELRALVTASLDEVMGADASSALELDAPLMASGLTSGDAVRITALIESRLGARLPATLVRGKSTLHSDRGVLHLAGQHGNVVICFQGLL